MHTEPPVTLFRQDYRPYPYAIEQVELQINLDADSSRVMIRFQAQSCTDQAEALELDGEDLELIDIKLNGQSLSPSDYTLTTKNLILYPTTQHNHVEIVSTCKPILNTSLMGLYVSGNQLFTQCEAQGFRRIAFFPDRPDVMARYKVKLTADKAQYPTLLSNGNLLSCHELDGGRHQAVWEDPFPKPSYLFALVAGDFDLREKQIQKANGQTALLQIYSDKGDFSKTEWAMQCLENSIRWDEQRFGLELDLNRFMIVAVRDFNMGAMENKGLNIFNSAYVLAEPNSTTDASYRAIEAVIGHEYFHNWTGNRVTCQDWFQLSLKEGLTVFREQEFSADMLAQGLHGAEATSARAVKRIDDVSLLRSAQFPEDAGPMAHPIRPESYEEISNFYTATIYEKGAEIIRMQHTLLGEAGFQAGMQEYFRRHDGQAVSCDDFVAAMESVYQSDKPDANLDVFRRWYSQAGTPTVMARLHHDPAAKTATLVLSQRNPAVGVETSRSPQIEKDPLHIPVSIGLIDTQGGQLTFSWMGSKYNTLLLNLTEREQSWTLTDIEQAPVLSILRGFSAPVKIEYYRSSDELVLLACHDPDPFARWEAAQLLVSRALLERLSRTGNKQASTSAIVKTYLALIQDNSLSPAYLARILSLPSERELLEQIKPMRPREMVAARQSLMRDIGLSLAPYWQELYQFHHDAHSHYSPDALSAGKRALKNLALFYLASAGLNAGKDLAWRQFQQASNMTDRLAALQTVVHYGPEEQSQHALELFYTQWQHDPLVIDRWFSIQACAPHTNVEHVKALMLHPAFSLRNPNRARSLIFQFCTLNFCGIHSSEGYQFWAEQVLALDRLNPEIAARLARVFDNWARFEHSIKVQLQAALKKIASQPDLSLNVREIVQKALTF